LILALPLVLLSCDLDGDGFGASDCDDGDAEVFPGAPETCNEMDDDCNGFVDDGLVFSVYRPDADRDLFGDMDAPGVRACAMPEGHVLDGTDCDDTEPEAHPGGSEVCDDIDNDCDFDVDEGLAVEEYRPDEDDDGWGDAMASPVESCSPLVDLVPTGGDCADLDPARHPGAIEVCNDVDDDCNGGIDDGLEFLTWYPDSDGDGFGDATAPPFLACDIPEDAVLGDNSDCDDSTEEVRPDAVDPCLDCDESNDAGCR
jgi:hypothetical protein